MVPAGAGLCFRALLHALDGLYNAGVFGTAFQHKVEILSVVSFITFVVSKIAVGIFAGGVVFGTLFPELQLNIGGTRIDSFWIGSVLVIVLTGLYTSLGGMRAVAYNDAVQVIVLISGSAMLTFYGLNKLEGAGDSCVAGAARTCSICGNR